MTSFWSYLSNMYWVSWALYITAKTQNYGLYLTKTARKCKTDKFLVMHPKHVLSIMGHVNHPRTPKLWAIAHKKGHKRKNNEFLVMPIKHVLSVMDLENHPKNPNLWTIAHETAQKCKNDEFLVIPLKHRLSALNPKCHWPCKSPRKPKIVGNSSWKRPKNAKTVSFWSCLSNMY
jgi:hypothetical protein